MNREELKEWIFIHCFNKVGKLNSRISFKSWWKNKNFENVLNEIYSFSSEIFSDNITERIYHIITGKDPGKCWVCSKPTQFLQYHSGYREHCSIDCSQISSKRIDKIKKNQDYTKTAETLRQSNLRKYGVEFTFQLEEVKKKIKDTKRKRYGNENYNNIEKNNKTCNEKYGVSSLLLLKEQQEFMRKRKFKLHGSIVPPKTSVSKAEKELIEWVNSISNYKFKKNKSLLVDREIDGYCPELKLAIEYCGLYWHSELFKNNNYHYDKYLRCKKIGVKLITIFEDEWIHRNKQVRNFLSANIGNFDKRIPARKCIFQEINNPKDFLNNNHIQGTANTIKYSFGLLYQNDLIGAVTFSIHHRNNKDLVLSRLAFEKGIQVIGGTSKLIKNSLEILNQNIITWSDNRYSNGKIYQDNGFNLEKEYKPDYSYYHNDNKCFRHPKQKMQKKKIGCPEHLTEHEYCKLLKFYRIYDCGKKKWVYNKENMKNG